MVRLIATRELAKDPSAVLDQIPDDVLPRAAREQMEGLMANRSESEREQLLKELAAAAWSGKLPDQSLLQPKKFVTPGAQRAQGQAKNKRRAANKRARQQRKRR